MAILSQQQVATFPIWGTERIHEEIVLWQPEEATQYWPPCDYTARFSILETCPWTDEMVQELWCRMLQETENKMALIKNETQGWSDLDELVKGEVIDTDEPTKWKQTSDLRFGLSPQDNKKKEKLITPEMVLQRDNLNWLYASSLGVRGVGDKDLEGNDIKPHHVMDITNVTWEPNEHEERGWTNVYVGDGDATIPDQLRELEIVSSRTDNYAIAKCDEGSVYIPKSAINHMHNVIKKRQDEWYDGNGLGKGTRLEAWITFTGDQYAQPWRITYQGVANVY